MSMALIRSNYGVQARRGATIRFAGALATIVGTQGQYLRARMHETCRWADAGGLVTLHPTWQVEYEATHPPTPHGDALRAGEGLS